MQILTKDSVTVYVNAIMYYKVGLTVDYSGAVVELRYPCRCTTVTWLSRLLMTTTPPHDPWRPPPSEIFSEQETWEKSCQRGRYTTASSKTLSFLSFRDSIAMEMKLTLDAATCPWGVLVERVEVKDVRVPEQLMRAMAAEAEAARNARAKVIAAEGEHKASRALRHAAEVIMENPAALQVERFIISQTDNFSSFLPS